MRAAVLHAPYDLRVEERTSPTERDLGPRDCLVQVATVGVCGSDVHYYEHGRIGPFVVEQPMILGHECSGVVIACGAEVRSLAEGDRVAIEPGVPCRRCDHCRTGRYNLCADVVFLATPPVDGALCDFVVFPDDYLFRLPYGVSLEEGAMVEPLAVAVHATRRAGVTMGDTVAVLGCGTIGLLTIQAARAAGASRVIATDLQPNRLALAEDFGAETLDASADPAAAILEATGGGGVDVAFETAGTVGTTQQTVRIVRTGGTACLVGLPPESVFPFDVMEILSRELVALGVFRYANCFADCVGMVASGQVRLGPLVTGRYTLTQAREALEFAANRKGECVKLVIDVAGA